MLLGDMIARCSDDALAKEVVLSIGDLAMLATLRERSATTGVGIGACIAAAARCYVANASDEEWIALMGMMSGAPDPGAVFLKRALARANRHKATAGCGWADDSFDPRVHLAANGGGSG